MKKLTVSTVLAALLVTLILALPGKNPYEKIRIPEPYSLQLDLAASWEQVGQILEKMGYIVDQQDRAGGLITTRPEESIAGAYASSELEKVAIITHDYRVSYHKGRYHLELRFQYIKPAVTQLEVSAIIAGLKRDLNGKDEWARLKSNGALEMRFMNELHIALTGKRLYDKEIPFWKKRSQEIDIVK